jgi:hypothetical protein
MIPNTYLGFPHLHVDFQQNLDFDQLTTELPKNNKTNIKDPNQNKNSPEKKRPDEEVQAVEPYKNVQEADD